MEDRLGASRLVSHDAQPEAGGGESSETWHHVGVQVLGTDGIGEFGGPRIGQRRPDIEARPEELEYLGVFATARDDGAESGEERQARNSQVVGPGGPGTRLIDERLPDVEDDRPDRQRLRSCQLVPPSGAPGSCCGRSPVRRSICSRPRR
jgi:hypothetical protein